MSHYHALVTVICESEEQASTVLTERLGHDEDYGFDYEVTWTQPGETHPCIVARSQLRRGSSQGADMSKYIVTFTSIVIEADSPDEAIEKACEFKGGGHWEAKEPHEFDLSSKSDREILVQLYMEDMGESRETVEAIVAARQEGRQDVTPASPVRPARETTLRNGPPLDVSARPAP